VSVGVPGSARRTAASAVAGTAPVRTDLIVVTARVAPRSVVHGNL